MSERKLIVWSGGCDSTLVLFEELVRSRARGYRADQAVVRTVSFVVDRIGAQQEQETARRRIVAKLRSDGHVFREETIRVTFGESVRFRAQPQTLMSLACSILESDEDLVFGWIRSDDAFHSMQSLRRAFDALRDAEPSYSSSTSRLLTPLEWMTKGTVIERLRRANLYELTWWCEEPSVPGVACNHCVPCEAHATALWKIDQRHDAQDGDLHRYGA